MFHEYSMKLGDLKISFVKTERKRHQQFASSKKTPIFAVRIRRLEK